MARFLLYNTDRPYLFRFFSFLSNIYIYIYIYLIAQFENNTHLWHNFFEIRFQNRFAKIRNAIKIELQGIFAKNRFCPTKLETERESWNRKIFANSKRTASHKNIYICLSFPFLGIWVINFAAPELSSKLFLPSFALFNYSTRERSLHRYEIRNGT